MVIDTSVLATIAFNEPEAAAFRERIADDPVRLISAATVLETAMVIELDLGRPQAPISTSGSTRQKSKSSQLQPNMPIVRGAPGGAMARDVIRPASTTATAFPMLLPRFRENRSSTRATIFRKPTSRRREDEVMAARSSRAKAPADVPVARWLEPAQWVAG